MIIKNSITEGGSRGMYRKLPVVPLERVLPYIRPATRDNKPRIELEGDPVKVYSVRLRCFKEHGITCVFCGLKGEYFAKERRTSSEPWHLNLYGFTKTGMEVLLTKDHVIPKSKGGPNTLDNMQTACAICNAAKGNDPNYRGRGGVPGK